MSVTFFIDGQPHGPSVNLANANARAFLEWLGYVIDDLVGSVPAADLAARCRRRLWPEARNEDPGLPVETRGRAILCGRRPGYLQEKAQEILALAELAGPWKVVFA